MTSTVPAAFTATADRLADTVALRQSDDAGTVSEWTWADYARNAGQVAASLGALGLRRGQRVALMLRNRAEFHWLDMGILLAGGTPVSLYNSSPPDRIAQAIRHSGAVLAVVEEDFLDRLSQARPDTPALLKVVSTGEGGDMTLAELDAAPVDVESAAGRIRPDDLATVIYTSGTTGEPKGVMLDHANVAFTVEAYASVLGRSLEGLRQVSYLPMAHIAERVATHYFHTAQGSVVTCCPDLNRLGAVMAAVQPQWFFSSPRLWEKLQAAIETLAGAGDDAGWRERQPAVIGPLLQRVGLGSVEIALTGAAPAASHTVEFFSGLGVGLSEVWAMSETTGTGTWSPHEIVPGTVGRPMPGVEVRLGSGDELLVRGGCVFRGYLDDPLRTAEVLDADGWLHTGDRARIDEEGRVTIIDRIKEIIVPSSGHNISPAQLEAQLKQHPLVGQACVVGDGRPHVVALLVLDPETAPGWAEAHSYDGLSLSELAEHGAVRWVLDAFVSELNRRCPPAERIAGFAVLADEWLPDSDLLTPTAKLKRRAISDRYATVIERLYDGR